MWLHRVIDTGITNATKSDPSFDKLSFSFADKTSSIIQKYSYVMENLIDGHVDFNNDVELEFTLGENNSFKADKKALQSKLTSCATMF